MYKHTLCSPVKKSINDKFIKVDPKCRKVTYDMLTKFELNRMYSLDTRTF